MENNRPVCKSTGGSLPTETTCEYNGKTYHNGDSFNSSDGCNQCSCNNGNVMCTLRACVQTCNYQGKTYKEGDSFPAGDGCNTCSCSGGQALCTLMACEISCHSDNDCDSGSYCQKESCEDNDIGVCTSRSSDMTCTTQGHDPVCGCDDRTYSNSCEAAKSCVNVKSSGECEANNSQPSQPSQPQPAQSSQHQPQELNCRNNNDCGSGDYCAKLTCDCEQGTCTKRSLSCNGGSPVCGCDGNTYSCQCEASRLGANVRSNGACPTTQSGGTNHH